MLSIIAGALFMFTFAISRQEVAGDAIRVGETLPDFTALDENGAKFDAASLRGRPGTGRICLIRCVVGPKYRCPVFSKVEMSGSSVSMVQDCASEGSLVVVLRCVPARSSRASLRVVVGFSILASARWRCFSRMMSIVSESRLFSTTSACCTL